MMPTDPSAPPLPTLEIGGPLNEKIIALWVTVAHISGLSVPAVVAEIRADLNAVIVEAMRQREHDLLLRESAQQAEPMNLRLFHDGKGRWFVRDGRLGGAGDTPEAAPRRFAMARLG